MNEDNAGGKFDQIAGKIKQGAGELVGNEKLANEGAAEQVKGHAKEAWGNVKDSAAHLSDSAKADADRESTVAQQNAHATGNTLRDKATSAAEHAKESIAHGLDHLEGKR